MKLSEIRKLQSGHGKITQLYKNQMIINGRQEHENRE